MGMAMQNHLLDISIILPFIPEIKMIIETAKVGPYRVTHRIIQHISNKFINPSCIPENKS